MKKRIVLLLVLALTVTSVGSVYACDYSSSWSITDTDYGNVQSDASTALAIVATLTGAVGYGGVAVWLGHGSLIAALGVFPWQAYYKRDTHTSPDGFAYFWRTTLYKNENYTGQIDDPVCSEIYYITASPRL